MSLLMCFFVLLLSFSELDVVKFKQIAGSMKHAFGVQNQYKVQNIPAGNSVIALEFSPGKPQDTPINRIEQVTHDLQRSSTDEIEPSKKQAKQNKNQMGDQQARKNQQLAAQLAERFKDELNSGQFELDNQGQQLVIRIKEQGAFASGSGFLQPALKPALQKLNGILVDIPGKIVVSGHTDNRALSNEMFKDNLELSAVRAIAVARELNHDKRLKFISVQGMGDTSPLTDNTTPKQRSKNRRVEITIHQGEAKSTQLPYVSKQS
jgi:chemotaxis protein MotB